MLILVATSTSFIREGGALSRGDVVQRGYYQTPQKYDEKDQEFDVWDDVFLDTCDFHGFS
jgi:hypothetical protein